MRRDYNVVVDAVVVAVVVRDGHWSRACLQKLDVSNPSKNQRDHPMIWQV